MAERYRYTSSVVNGVTRYYEIYEVLAQDVDTAVWSTTFRSTTMIDKDKKLAELTGAKTDLQTQLAIINNRITNLTNAIK
jgi:hypothetical protein